MRLLLDTCVWRGAADALSRSGHDVRWIGDETEDPGDEAVLECARQEGRVLVTLDKDFGELAVLWGARHVGIVRIVQIRAADQGPVCHAAVTKYEDEIMNGAIVTVEPNRVRVRTSDNQTDSDAN